LVKPCSFFLEGMGMGLNPFQPAKKHSGIVVISFQYFPVVPWAMIVVALDTLTYIPL
jgi:hypothetical protein